MPRGDVPRAVLADLEREGVAVIQGPAGSGTSWGAMAVARRFEGPVTWIRPGLWIHLADLARPLWAGPAPSAVQEGSAEELVEEVLAVLRRTDGLMVLDDFDDVLDRPPARPRPRDPDLALLLNALEAGELRGSGAGVLLCTRRSLAEVSAPIRPLPLLPPAAAAELAGRDVADLPDAWLRRPGALALLRHLGPDDEVPDIDDPWDALVLAVAERHLTTASEEVLLGLSAARNPAPLAGLADAIGLDEELVQRALVALMNLDLAVLGPGGWRCPRVVASAARQVLPERLPGVMPGAIGQRLAGWYFRTGQDWGEGWTSADPARASRLGLRYATAEGNSQMALQLLMHGGMTPLVDKHRGWRMLRDDLGLALEAGTDGDEELRAGAWLARARAAERVADHRATEQSLVAALPLAREVGDPAQLLAVHRTMARRALLGGDLTTAHGHLRAALAAAHPEGEPAVLSDLHHQLGGVALQTGRLDDAEQAFSRSLDLARRAGDARRAAARKAGLGGVLLYRGALRDAQAMLEEAVADGREAGDDLGVAQRLLNVALVRSMRGDPPGALRELARLAELGVRDPRARCRLLAMRSSLLRLGGRLDSARRDLDQARPLASKAGDRELVSDLASSEGHLHRIEGDFEQAVVSFRAAIAALGPGREESLVATREAERWNAEAWLAAGLWTEGEPDAINRILEASRELAARLERVPRRPFFPRWLTLRLLVAEGQLLAAQAAGTAPMGLVRYLEICFHEADDDPERVTTGEPAIQLARAWALALCGRREEAARLATEAELAARIQGLETVAGRCRALQGQEPQPWNGQAQLLLRLMKLRQ